MHLLELPVSVALPRHFAAGTLSHFLAIMGCLAANCHE
jgi:hypothetical protein